MEIQYADQMGFSTVTRILPAEFLAASPTFLTSWQAFLSAFVAAFIALLVVTRIQIGPGRVWVGSRAVACLGPAGLIYIGFLLYSGLVCTSLPDYAGRAG